MLHVERFPSTPEAIRPIRSKSEIPATIPILQAMAGNAEHVETEMAAMAAQFVNSTNRNVFLTGKAGTGKTTFLRRLADNTHKRYIILAPTGIAALNAGGVTIHSQFLLPFGTFVPERTLPSDLDAYGNFHDRDKLTRRHPLNSVRRGVLRDVELLIIDEVSMLRADLLDAIDHRMRNVRKRWDLPFGGAQLLMIGDLYQLPPVVKDDEWRVLQRWYRSPHFFEAHVIQQAGYAHIELDKIFRQQDEGFIGILNNLRENTVTAADVEVLNSFYKPVIEDKDSDGVITLSTHNRQADEINQKALAKLPGKLHSFEAKVNGEFPESMFPVLRDLELKVGAQVMFTRNDPEKQYFNGKLARVESITDDGIMVRMVDGDVQYMLREVEWENKRYVVEPTTKEQKEQVLGGFIQYPVKLAWAITVHKSQGLTFDKAIIDVGQAFAPGQVYVALSRLRSLQGLILRTRISPNVVSTDRDVVAFSERRHVQQPLPEQLKEQQMHYLRMVLTSTFDLGDILRRVELIQRDSDTANEFEDESMKTALARFMEKLRSEEGNSRKFQSQLLRLIQEQDRESLLARIGKGAEYYSVFLLASMKDLLQHLSQVEQITRNKQYSEDLRELDSMLVKKVGMIAKADHVTSCILQGVEVVKQPELERKLAQQRTAMVEEVKAWAVENRPKTSTKTGRKRRVADAGEWDLPATKSERKAKGKKPVKGETYLKSFALLNSGKSLLEVAAERGLSLGTIEGHAAKGIAEGEVSIDAVLASEARDAMADWIRENPDKGSNDVRGYFGDAYSYGQIRMVQAWLKLAD